MHSQMFQVTLENSSNEMLQSCATVIAAPFAAVLLTMLTVEFPLKDIFVLNKPHTAPPFKALLLVNTTTEFK